MSLNSSRKLREPARSAPAFCETLENRLLMHEGPLKVLSVVAGNRGEVLITMNQAVDPTDVTKTNIQMRNAGPDNILGNGDDVRVAASVKYQASANRILVRANLPAGTAYRIKMQASRISTADGHSLLDGEFNGTFPSGDNTAGGNFEFQVKNDRSNTPLVRMSTTEGVMTLRMRKDVAPNTVLNFQTYMDAGNFDNMFFTRSIPGFIIQGGSLQIDANNEVIEGPIRSPVVNEFNLSNIRGTMAMAKAGGDPNSATNQFFFNLADNSSNLNNQNGGFTVFAQVANSSGLAVMDAIAANKTFDLSAQMGPFAATGVTDVPVRSDDAANKLDPSNHLIVVRRVEQLMRVFKL